LQKPANRSALSAEKLRKNRQVAYIMHFSDRETLLSLFLGLSFSEEGYPRHDVQRDVARALKRRSKEEIRSILGRITSG